MKRLLLLFLAAVLLLCGCSAPQVQDFAPDEAERLVIYTSHKKDVWWPIVKEFEARTGIWVQVVQGGTNELLEALSQEKNAPQCDVMFGGGVESLEAAGSLFAPYESAAAQNILPQYQSDTHLWTPFSSLPLVLIYNPKLIRGDRVTGWESLLKPFLRGKIAFADPAVSGSSYTALATVLQALPEDRDTVLRTFADNLAGKQLSSSGDVLSAVAQGECWVGVTLEETASRRIAAGDQLVLVYPAEGTSAVPDGSALIKGAPHEDNAKLFLDFVLSRGAQERLAQQFYRRPVRSDIQRQKELSPLEDIALIDYSVSWASENHDHMLERWSALMEQEAGR